MGVDAKEVKYNFAEIKDLARVNSLKVKMSRTRFIIYGQLSEQPT